MRPQVLLQLHNLSLPSLPFRLQHLQQPSGLPNLQPLRLQVDQRHQMRTSARILLEQLSSQSQMRSWVYFLHFSFQLLSLLRKLQSSGKHLRCGAKFFKYAADNSGSGSGYRGSCGGCTGSFILQVQGGSSSRDGDRRGGGYG